MIDIVRKISAFPEDPWTTESILFPAATHAAMTASRRVVMLLVTLMLACGSSIADSPTTSQPASRSSPLIGEWRWVRSCEAFVAAFRDAGLADLSRPWLVNARYFAREDQIGAGDPCEGAEETPYVYFFEESGRWGMLDDDDVLVEDRGFSVVDQDTIAFGEVLVDFRIGSDGTLTFDVAKPEQCEDGCPEDHAWVVATFAPGTFRRVA